MSTYGKFSREHREHTILLSRERVNRVNKGTKRMNSSPVVISCFYLTRFYWENCCLQILRNTVATNSHLGLSALSKKYFWFKDVRTNCFCASLLRTTARANSHATSCIEHARQVLKGTMIGQTAIAIALLGFNDLGRSVTPTFLFRNRLYLQLSPHCSKMNKKSTWEVIKISRFLSTGHGILPLCGC